MINGATAQRYSGAGAQRHKGAREQGLNDASGKWHKGEIAKRKMSPLRVMRYLKDSYETDPDNHNANQMQSHCESRLRRDEATFPDLHNDYFVAKPSKFGKFAS